MPKIIGKYTAIKVGHKVLVESDVKPAFKGAKVCSAYYAIQIKDEKNDHLCILLTEADLKSAQIVTGQILPFDGKIELGKFTEGPKAKMYIKLYNEDKGREDVYCFYKNVITRGFERAKKHPNLCTSMSLFTKLFS